MKKLFNSTKETMEESDRKDIIIDQKNIENSKKTIKRKSSDIENATPEELSSLIVANMVSLLEEDMKQIFSQKE